MADVNIKTLRTAIDGSLTTVDVTHPGFGTVKGAIVIAVPVTSNGAIDSGNVPGICVGFTDFSDNWVCSCYAGNNLANTVAGRTQRNDRVISFGVGPSFNDGYAATLSTITDGVRIVPSLSNNRPMMVTIILFGGNDLNVKVGGNRVIPTSGAGLTVSDVGFEPSLVLMSHAAVAAVSAYTANAYMGLGASVNQSPIKNKSISMFGLNNQSTSTVGARVSDTFSALQVFGAATQWTSSVSAFNSNGFVISGGAGSNNDVFGFIAIELLNGSQADLVNFDMVTSGQQQLITPFSPQLAMLVCESAVSVARETLDVDGVSAYSISATDGQDFYLSTFLNRDGQATTQTGAFADTSLLLHDHVGGFANVGYSAPAPSLTPTGLVTTPTVYPPSVREVGFGIFIGEPVTAGGIQAQIWDGSSWLNAQPVIWNGSAWVNHDPSIEGA